ncbi:gluconate 2-dehydrogenase subunit 3 family protein [Rhizobium sp. L1K21]|uniref:gluconate 2-dehydrogenase subunit 3 family protein n=1 Tax=Rhizobium sp. L1K21 TaxID=2954933 RepID=UPI0020934ED3|nr:gluconate 2-dehydrogenase subunit 3 family protein [Rhizobium sp. L1K21]MCO6187721.1 gluconate 2-dehydrogenase subunit 3 family protein [Rhizobium sp. L1K21]
MHLTRRALLTGASLIALSSTALARTYIGGVPWEPEAANPPQVFDPSARFFTSGERDFVTAAVDRLIPEDEFASASQAGVVTFLENQLSGAYGRGDIYYMHAPFSRGEPSQGYQERAPAILYRQAIADIAARLQADKNKTFQELSEEEQDQFLLDLSNGDVELEHVDAKTFFDTFWQDTQLGFFGDPVHGGNRDMVSWRMVGFPGARYDYRPYIDHNGRELNFEPISVAGAISQGGKS